MESILNKIKQEYDEIDGLQLYYTLRLFVSKRTKACVELVKWFIATEKILGDGNITAYLLCNLTKKEYNNVLSQLHQLGDYGVTKARRTKGKVLFFQMTDDFKERLNNIPINDDFDIEEYWEAWRDRDQPFKWIE